MKATRIFEQAKTSLYNEVDYNNPLDYCNARVIGNTKFEILRSYVTDVAVWDKRNGLILVDGWYSTTTDKHISKWVKVHDNIPIIYLYKRSNNIAVLYNKQTSRVILKYGKRIVNTLVIDYEQARQNDFEDVINFVINME